MKLLGASRQKVVGAQAMESFTLVASIAVALGIGVLGRLSVVRIRPAAGLRGIDRTEPSA